MVSRDTRLLDRHGRFSSRPQLSSRVSVSAPDEAYDVRIVRVDYCSWTQLVAPNLYPYRLGVINLLRLFYSRAALFPRGDRGREGEENVSYTGQRFAKMIEQFVTRILFTAREPT